MGRAMPEVPEVLEVLEAPEAPPEGAVDVPMLEPCRPAPRDESMSGSAPGESAADESAAAPPRRPLCRPFPPRPPAARLLTPRRVH